MFFKSLGFQGIIFKVLDPSDSLALSSDPRWGASVNMIVTGHGGLLLRSLLCGALRFNRLIAWHCGAGWHISSAATSKRLAATHVGASRVIVRERYFAPGGYCSEQSKRNPTGIISLSWVFKSITCNTNVENAARFPKHYSPKLTGSWVIGPVFRS